MCSVFAIRLRQHHPLPPCGTRTSARVSSGEILPSRWFPHFFTIIFHQNILSAPRFHANSTLGRDVANELDSITKTGFTPWGSG